MAQIIKDALEKGEISLQSGKELALGMKLKAGEQKLAPIEDASFKLRTDTTEKILQRAEKEIVYPKEQPSPISFKESHFKEALQEAGLSEKEFQRLNLTSIEKYTAREVEQMKLIRERVPKITEDTLLHKTIPEESIEKILSGDPRSQNVGGYIARAEDVQHIKNYDEVVETLRLDYDATPFIESKNSYGLIKFKVQKPDTVDIPYSKVLGGTEDIKAPCTGNGFTATRNGDVIPEWKAKYELPRDGAELYRVVDGKEELIARYIEIEDGEGYFMKLPKKDK